MRRTPRSLSLAAITVLISLAALADEPPAPAVTVRIDVQIVSVSLADAPNLISELKDRTKAKAAWNRLQEMIGNDRAKLIGWPMVWSPGGQRGVDENFLEYRSSIELDELPPPSFGSFSTRPLLFPTWGPFTPCGFTSRNLGENLEVEPFVEKGGDVVNMNIVSQSVRLIQVKKWQTQWSPLGIAGVKQRPDFQDATVTTTLRVHRNEPVLIGAFFLSAPQPHAELHILHARVKLLPVTVPLPASQ